MPLSCNWGLRGRKENQIEEEILKSLLGLPVIKLVQNRSGEDEKNQWYVPFRGNHNSRQGTKGRRSPHLLDHTPVLELVLL